MGSNSLTTPSDWDEYYSRWHLSPNFYKHYITGVMDRYIWNQKPGKIFEIGSGGSRLLARSGCKGWEISGIDFHSGANHILRIFAKENNIDVGEIIDADACEYDCTKLEGTYDALISSTTLCHFRHPEEILRKWIPILKTGGPVLTVLPNLFSINGAILKKYDPEQLRMYNNLSLEAIDRYHIDAGLEVVTPAYLTGGFDSSFYIPWQKIKGEIPSLLIFKLIKYAVTAFDLTIGKALPFNGSRTFNRHIIGAYRKP